MLQSAMVTKNPDAIRVGQRSRRLTCLWGTPPEESALRALGRPQTDMAVSGLAEQDQDWVNEQWHATFGLEADPEQDGLPTGGRRRLSRPIGPGATNPCRLSACGW
ncbi:hypothetical protein NKDENANG_03640 [Candidatus Entotheonellaceae bacterium PAL068K]